MGTMYFLKDFGVRKNKAKQITWTNFEKKKAAKETSLQLYNIKIVVFFYTMIMLYSYNFYYYYLYFFSLQKTIEKVQPFINDMYFCAVLICNWFVFIIW